MRTLYYIIAALLFPLAAAQTMSNSNFVFDADPSPGSTNSSSSNYQSSFAVTPVSGNASSANFRSFFGFFFRLQYANGDPCEANRDCMSGACCSGTCLASCPAGAAASAGGGGGGGGGGGSNATIEWPHPGFSASPGSITFTLVLGAEDEKQISVTNTGNTDLDLSIDISGEAASLLSSDSSLSIAEGSSAQITLQASSGQQPGVYVGKLTLSSEGISKEIPVTIEVKTADIIFDVSLDIPNHEIPQGRSLYAQITLFNLKERGTDVQATYIIKDLDGNVLFQSNESLKVQNQLSYRKEYNTQNLEKGAYVAIVEILYKNGFAVSSQTFTITEPQPFSFANVIGVVVALILLLLLLRSRFRKMPAAPPAKRSHGLSRKSRRGLRVSPFSLAHKPPVAASSALHLFSKERHLARKGQPPPLLTPRLVEPRKKGGNADVLLSRSHAKLYKRRFLK